MSTNQQDYQKLIAKMNQQMLVTDDDRVPLLQQILAKLGHPDHAYQIIHIAGTNGKGSTGAMLAAVLQKNGYHIGHFSSPAMLDDREQIKIDGQMIGYTDFLQAYQLINDQLPANFATNSLSIFEWFTLIALVAFQQAKVDFVILEVGLGGTNDATNAISAPLLALITHIDYDHTRILGHSIRKIATQKSGIIKTGSTVIVAPHQKRITRTVLRNVAGQQQVPIHFVNNIRLKVLAHNFTGTTVQISGPLIPNQTIQLGLIGGFQLDNLATVLSATTWLQKNNVQLDQRLIHEALAQLKIAGRMQVVQHHPTVILDGAHNPDGAKQLVHSLKKLAPNHKITFLLGFLADKNYLEMLQNYLPLAKEIYVNTPSQHQRALDKDQLSKTIQTHFSFPKEQLFNEPDAHASLSTALKHAATDDVIVITGSFYFIKQFEGDQNV